jgi:hypothetical protein
MKKPNYLLLPEIILWYNANSRVFGRFLDFKSDCIDLKLSILIFGAFAFEGIEALVALLPPTATDVELELSAVVLVLRKFKGCFCDIIF